MSETISLTTGQLQVLIVILGAIAGVFIAYLRMSVMVMGGEAQRKAHEDFIPRRELDARLKGIEESVSKLLNKQGERGT